MNAVKPPSLTVEDAVKLRLNMHYIPFGFSLLDMASAYVEEPSYYLDHARELDLTQNEIKSCEFSHEAAYKRLAFAKQLIGQLEHEINSPEDSMIVLSSDSNGDEPKMTYESVSDWVGYRYGIEIRMPVSRRIARWEDVNIKIYADYKIGWSVNKGRYIRKSFQDIGFIDKRKNSENFSAFILIGLSQGKKYPPLKPDRSYRVQMTRLRDSLVKLTGIQGDPFYPFTEGDGWKSRFKLIDDRRNADERAKREAKHVRLDEAEAEAADINREDDETQEYLDQHN